MNPSNSLGELKERPARYVGTNPSRNHQLPHDGVSRMKSDHYNPNSNSSEDLAEPARYIPNIQPQNPRLGQSKTIPAVRHGDTAEPRSYARGKMQNPWLGGPYQNPLNQNIQGDLVDPTASYMQRQSSTHVLQQRQGNRPLVPDQQMADERKNRVAG